MNFFRRRIRIITGFSILLLGGAFLAYLAGGGIGVPTEFREARLRGALVAQSIVSLSKESQNTLEEINRLDRAGRYAEALDLTTGLTHKNEELRAKAADLSREVEIMTKSLAQVPDTNAQQAALSSISSRLAMINHLISYSQRFEELLAVLRGKFEGERVPNARPVNTIISDINLEITAINNFDTEAQKAIDSFDTIIGEKATPTSSATSTAK